MCRRYPIQTDKPASQTDRCSKGHEVNGFVTSGTVQGGGKKKKSKNSSMRPNRKQHLLQTKGKSKPTWLTPQQSIIFLEGRSGQRRKRGTHERPTLLAEVSFCRMSINMFTF
ncbi:hypothetical protein BO99DRAFT_406111 [Aspergillus violaceofuscus CBS 115571]|uniref:Uncharacterized protein n=1 Tax=Aspergillus violaceofuscus (strain CBS 115571) TaxID=1450538 RepID=A0A2V5GUT9_ASPV1|nr:hypothetical protein BO99DRAFT_406111 [Aspergillus violaceofuscus CBS 115571]